jgi:hypothetical protein
VIDVHTRGELAAGRAAVEVIWTFDPVERSIEIITPLL